MYILIFLVFVILIGRPFGVWIFKKERPLGFRHHESLRSWKQVLHPNFSPFLPLHLFFLDSVFFYVKKMSFCVTLLRVCWDFDFEAALDLFLDEFLSPLFDLSVFLICLLHSCLLCSVKWDGWSSYDRTITDITVIWTCVANMAVKFVCFNLIITLCYGNENLSHSEAANRNWSSDSWPRIQIYI